MDALREVHAALEAPALLVWGDRDPYFPAEKARAMVDQLPAGSRFELVEGGGTFLHEDRAEELARLARPFLSERLGEARAAS